MDTIPESAQVAMVREAITDRSDLTRQILQAWEQGNEGRFSLQPSRM